MCEFHESTFNGFGDIWWTDKPIYFSSIDGSGRKCFRLWRSCTCDQICFINIAFHYSNYLLFGKFQVAVMCSGGNGSLPELCRSGAILHFNFWGAKTCVFDIILLSSLEIFVTEVVAIYVGLAMSLPVEHCMNHKPSHITCTQSVISHAHSTQTTKHLTPASEYAGLWNRKMCIYIILQQFYNLFAIQYYRNLVRKHCILSMRWSRLPSEHYHHKQWRTE